MSEGRESPFAREREPERAANEYQAVEREQVEREARYANNDQSIARIMGELVADAQHLFRKEVDLARHEVQVEIKKGLQGVISLASGAAVTAAGGLLLLFAVVYLLWEVAGISLWVSFLLVGVVLAVIGVILLLMGRARLQQLDPTPHETIDSVRKDAEWIREQSPSGRK